MSAARSYNDGYPQAIAISEATVYAREVMGITQRDKLAAFMDLVQILDNEFLTYKSKKIKEEAGKPTPK